MKKLQINITKAQLTSFEVKLEDGKPVVNVTIALLNEMNEVITSYTIFSDEWHSKKFDLPIEAMPLIGSLATIFEGVAVRHCQAGQKALSAPVPATEEEIDAINDQVLTNASAPADSTVINLSEVPF